eukprot:3595250-Rhodomonas_salina.1
MPGADKPDRRLRQRRIRAGQLSDVLPLHRLVILSAPLSCILVLASFFWQCAMQQPLQVLECSLRTVLGLSVPSKQDGRHQGCRHLSPPPSSITAVSEACHFPAAVTVFALGRVSCTETWERV